MAQRAKIKKDRTSVKGVAQKNGGKTSGGKKDKKKKKAKRA